MRSAIILVQQLDGRQDPRMGRFKPPGVRFFQTLRKEPWGATTFIVLQHPDGNLLLFAGPGN